MAGRNAHLDPLLSACRTTFPFPLLHLCFESCFDLLCPSPPFLHYSRPSFSSAAMSHLLSLQFMNPLLFLGFIPFSFLVPPPPHLSSQHHLCAVIRRRYSCLLYQGFSWLSSFSHVNRTNRSSFDQIILWLTPGFHHSCVVILLQTVSFSLWLNHIFFFFLH